MRGNGRSPPDQLLGLIEVVSQMAAELPETGTETRQELINALAIAMMAALRLAAEHRLVRKNERRV